MTKSAMGIAKRRRSDGSLLGPASRTSTATATTASVPFQVADVNYWLSGETPALIPDDYFTNCQSMLALPGAEDRRHMETYDDDYIPFLFPWYGTGVIASALGAKIVFQPKMDPAVQGTVISGPEQVRQLSLPDPHKDGLMPRVLETIRYFREALAICRSPLPTPGPVHHGADAGRPGDAVRLALRVSPRRCTS